MDGQQVKLWESRCIEESPPACAAACPVHVDARGLAELLAKGDFKAAHALFCRFIPFPGIVGHLCDHHCESACRRAEAGEAIRIRSLERAVASCGLTAPPFRRGRAPEKKRVAVVGAGLSGMTAAADLVVKGHEVSVFEAGPQLFGRLRADPRLPPAALEADLARFDNTGVVFRCNERPDIAVLAEEFDAVYLGLGFAPVPELSGLLDLTPDGRIVVDPLTYASRYPKIFAGGSHRYGEKYSPINSLYDGRCAALSIERLLQGASLTANREGQGSQPTRLHVNIARYEPSVAVVPANADTGYSAAEAQAEAQRCFPCHCRECAQVCPYLEHYGGYPKRYIREIYNNETIVMGARKANRMIDSCMLCGLCAEVCPEELSMGEVCLLARQGMVDGGHMPPSHHDFALRDLAYSRSDAFTLVRHQPGHERSAVVFYPGCQLAASSPEHVARVYAHLCATVEGGVGLMLGCCGAPAHWAGRIDLFAETRTELAGAWHSLGRPLVLTACSSCYRMIADHLPEVPVESLWPVLARGDLSGNGIGARLAIHDPCTTRHEPVIQDAVRRLIGRCGVEADELDGPQLTSCCGFGGLAQFADREVADKSLDRRIAQSESDYLTYCAMCRDNFARRGKRAVHVLDLLFPGDADPAVRPDPGFSRRQENRGRLKRRLLHELWNDAMEEPVADIELVISTEVHADLERKLILEDDLRQVLRHAESTGQRLLDRQSGHFIASHRPVCITYWVEYSVDADSGRYVVHGAYSHRMDVEAAP